MANRHFLDAALPSFRHFCSQGYPPLLCTHFLHNNICKSLISQSQYSCVYICLFFSCDQHEGDHVCSEHVADV